EVERRGVVEKAKRRDETLARAHCPLTGCGELRHDIGAERILARKVELVHGTRIAKPLGELRARISRRFGETERMDGLKRRNRPVIAPPRLSGDAKCLCGGAQLRLMEAIGGGFLPCGQ